MRKIRKICRQNGEKTQNYALVCFRKLCPTYLTDVYPLIDGQNSKNITRISFMYCHYV